MPGENCTKRDLRRIFCWNLHSAMCGKFHTVLQNIYFQNVFKLLNVTRELLYVFYLLKGNFNCEFLKASQHTLTIYSCSIWELDVLLVTNSINHPK